LKLCYDSALNHGMSYNKKDNSIALMALGTDVGVPRKSAACVAVSTILEFIQQNPNAYVLIHLFVKKHFEFALYKKLIEERLYVNYRNVNHSNQVTKALLW